MSVITKGFGLNQRIIVKGFGEIAGAIIVKMVHAVSLVQRVLNLVSK
jgi:hypothetical protein